jgi:hypothetical protein
VNSAGGNTQINQEKGGTINIYNPPPVNPVPLRVSGMTGMPPFSMSPPDVKETDFKPQVIASLILAQGHTWIVSLNPRPDILMYLVNSVEEVRFSLNNVDWQSSSGSDTHLKIQSIAPVNHVYVKFNLWNNQTLGPFSLAVSPE